MDYPLDPRPHNVRTDKDCDCLTCGLLLRAQRGRSSEAGSGRCEQKGHGGDAGCNRRAARDRGFARQEASDASRAAAAARQDAVRRCRDVALARRLLSRGPSVDHAVSGAARPPRTLSKRARVMCRTVRCTRCTRAPYSISLIGPDRVLDRMILVSGPVSGHV